MKEVFGHGERSGEKSSTQEPSRWPPSGEAISNEETSNGEDSTEDRAGGGRSAQEPSSEALTNGQPRSLVYAFSLQPFGQSATDLGLRLEGRLARQGERLRVRYQLSGDLPSVVLPPPATMPPERADGLWQHTCFELFLAAEGEAPYWEVNLAPSGAWNLYHLADYRQGLRAVSDRDALPFGVSATAELLELSLDLLLPGDLSLACRQRPLRLAVTAVIEQRGGSLSYWALTHGGPQADFHRREDFHLRLDSC
ncbi:MAG: DOMON-like domain-containing protein [Cyanobacteriota bacterium]